MELLRPVVVALASGAELGDEEGVEPVGGRGEVPLHLRRRLAEAVGVDLGHLVAGGERRSIIIGLLGAHGHCMRGGGGRGRGCGGSKTKMPCVV